MPLVTTVMNCCTYTVVQNKSVLLPEDKGISVSLLTWWQKAWDKHLVRKGRETDFGWNRVSWPVTLGWWQCSTSWWLDIKELFILWQPGSQSRNREGQGTRPPHQEQGSNGHHPPIRTQILKFLLLPTGQRMNLQHTLKIQTTQGKPPPLALNFYPFILRPPKAADCFNVHHADY